MMVRDRYCRGDEETLRDKPVYIKKPMTGDGMRLFLERAEQLLDEIDGYPVDCLQAYRHGGRVGVRVKPGHDPLINGIITGNVEGFQVEAVRPVDSGCVYIRFQKTDYLSNG